MNGAADAGSGTADDDSHSDGPSTGGSQVNTPNGSGSLTISLSAIIASVWAGIWGFDWAASHLDGTELLVTILVGLFVGTGLTTYLVERSFRLAAAAPAGTKTIFKTE